MNRWSGEDYPLHERPSTRRQLDLYEPALAHWNMPPPAELPVPTAWGESAHGWSIALCSCSVTGWGGCPVGEHYEQGQMREARLRARLYAKARQDVRWAAFGSVAAMAMLAVLLIWAGQVGGAW